MRISHLNKKNNISITRVKILIIINLNISHIMLNNNNKMEVMDISLNFRLKGNLEKVQDRLSEL
jgi:hypothetical protein